MAFDMTAPWAWSDKKRLEFVVTNCHKTIVKEELAVITKARIGLDDRAGLCLSVTVELLDGMANLRLPIDMLAGYWISPDQWVGKACVVYVTKQMDVRFMWLKNASWSSERAKRVFLTE